MAGTGSDVFAVWAYVIAHTQPDSLVELNPFLLSQMIGISIDAVEKAIAHLCKPDPKSRSKEHRGRRLIREGEYLYFVPQAKKYRSLPNDSERKQYFRDRKRASRERLATGQTGKSKTVKGSQSVSKPVKQAEAEAEAESRVQITPPTPLLRGASGKNVKPALNTSPQKLPDSEWIAQLTNDPTYAGIDVKRELGKMANWCNVKQVTVTRRRFINWLNRAEKPLSGGESGEKPKGWSERLWREYNNESNRKSSEN